MNDDVVKEKASKLAAEKAVAMAAALKSAADFAAAAKKAGVEVKTSELVARGTALPDVGLNQTVETAVFALPGRLGQRSDLHARRHHHRQGDRTQGRHRRRTARRA